MRNNLLKNICILLAFFLLPGTGIAQPSYTGIVRTQGGIPLNKVSVKVAGLESAVTDDKGRFEILKPKNGKLLFEKEGYLSTEVETGSNSVLTVILYPDVKKQVVEKGYGSETFLATTEAISSTSGDRMTSLHETAVSNTLAGKIAGLTVMQKGGEPGNNIADMYIRGKNTYNNNAQLLVFVDGFESDMNTLVAEEIESVTILKDAAALAVYGIRGANGVILVKTKRGMENKIQVRLNLKAGYTQPLKAPQFLDSYGYASLYNEALSNDMGHWSPYYNDADLALYRNGEDPYMHPNINWNDEVMREGTFYEEGNVSVSGGNSVVKFYTLLGFMNSPKFYRNNDDTGYKDLKRLGNYSRYNIRSNIDVAINKVFGLSVNIGGTISDGTKPNTDNIFTILDQTPPNAFPVKNYDGSWAAGTIYKDNPVAMLFASGKNSSHILTYQTDFSLTQNLDMYVKGLSLKESISFFGQSHNRYIINKDYARFQMVETLDGYQLNKVGGANSEFAIDESERTRTQLTRTTYSGQVDYNRLFGKNRVGAMIGAMYSRYVIDGNNVPYLNAGLFGRVGYGYDERYFAQFAFAYNGSENLPAKNRFGFFPSVSAAWVISNEDFFGSATSKVDLLKLRASAGMVGSSDLGATRFGYRTYYEASKNKYNIGAAGSTSLPGLVEGRLGNPDITYEKNYKYNVGVDASFFKRLSVMFDYFYEKRNGILATREASIPAVVAATLPYENIGKVSNQGAELEFGYHDKFGDVSLGIGGNIAYAKSKIEYQAEVFRPESYLYRTGNPVGQYFGLQAEGLFNSWTEINDLATPRQTFAPVQPGDIRYKDMNGDGVVNENDEKAVGYSPIPQLNYGIALNIGYKGFDLLADIYGQARRSVLLSGNTVWAFYKDGQAPEMAQNRWAYYPEQGIDTRAGATYPRLTTSDNDNNYRNSSFWIRDAGFMRLRNLELGYTFPEKLLKKSCITYLRLYINANNLFTVSQLKDFDPEVLSGYPLSRVYSLGVTVQF